jgi:hypothetical protein
LPLALVGAGVFTVKHFTEQTSVVDVVERQEAPKKSNIDEKILDIVTTGLRYDTSNQDNDRRGNESNEKAMQSYFKIKYGDNILTMYPFGFSGYWAKDKNEFREELESNLEAVKNYLKEYPQGFEQLEKENEQIIRDIIGNYRIEFDYKIDAQGNKVPGHERNIDKVLRQIIDKKYGTQNLPDSFYEYYSSRVNTFQKINKRVKVIKEKLELRRLKK